MEISVVDDQSSMSIAVEALDEIIPEILALEEQTADEVSIHFVETERICGLHDEFFNDPSTTDCISFPMDDEDIPGYRVLGEVFVCPQTAIDYVAKHGGDPYREVLLYTIHGLLHLMGYDDIAEQDREQMRAAEARHLAHLDSKGLRLYAANQEDRALETQTRERD